MIKGSQTAGERYTPQLGYRFSWIVVEGLDCGRESIDGVGVASKVAFGAEFNVFPDRADPSLVGRCRSDISWEGRGENLTLLGLDAVQRYLVGAEYELAGRKKPFLVPKQKSESRSLRCNNDARYQCSK